MMGSEMLQLEKDEGKDKGNSPENDGKDHVLSGSQNCSDKDLADDSEENLEGHRVNLSEKIQWYQGRVHIRENW